MGISERDRSRRVHEMLRGGGSWLGAARKWVQAYKHNGSTVEWGSSEEIRPPFTMREVEQMALEVAAAAILEDAQRINIKI